MGVKAHYKGEWENDKVALYQFDGGYCGVSKVEDNVINVCYLVNTSAFKKVGDLRRFEDEVMCQNPNFNEVYRRLNRVMERKVISQIYFGKKEKVNDQVAFLGDAAGMIFPLAGNGMAIAVHSAKIYCDLIDEFLKGNKSMEDVERLYEKKWLSLFNARIVNSKRLQLLMENSLLSKIAINMLTYIPFVFKRIIKGTHGKKVNVFN
jgi:flavin-dependent dehydrogenase